MFAAARACALPIVLRLALACAAAAAVEARAEAPRAPADADCLACHGERDAQASDGTSVAVDAARFAASAHGRSGVGCVGCHADLSRTTEFPHREKLARVDCGACHDPVTEGFRGSAHAAAWSSSPTGASGCRVCHDAHRTASKDDPGSPTSPFRVDALCLSCHRDLPPRKAGRDQGFVASYESSAHAAALKKSGLNIAATCVRCHGAHEVRTVGDARSPVSRRAIVQTCGSCHGGIAAQYRESVHGRSFAAGNDRSPVCTDCHGEHRVERATAPSSRVYARNVPETCGRCHGDERLVAQMQLATRRVATFQSSFHGIALKFGELKVANCASCHGYHDVLSGSDPRSRVHASNLAATCGSCHPNVGTNWAIGKVHLADPKTDNFGVWLVRGLYRASIAAIVGVFGLFIGADLCGHWRRRKGRAR